MIHTHKQFLKLPMQLLITASIHQREAEPGGSIQSLTAYLWEQVMEGNSDYAQQEFPEEWYDEHEELKYELPNYEEILLLDIEQRILIEKDWAYLYQDDQGFVYSQTFHKQMKQVWFLDGHDCPTFEWKPVD